MGTVRIGDPAPGFNLPGVDGKSHSLDEFQEMKAVVVIFSCNHCPTVKAYEDRLVAIQRDYANREVALVTINSNETRNYPEDSFENMKIRAKQKGFNFPYLRDESQSVARAYGAQRTPEVYVFDRNRKLRYHGCIDDNVYEPKEVRFNYLRDALDAVIAEKHVPLEETEAVGCTIKWK